MSEGEEETSSDRAFTLLHELACDIIDGCDMVGINGVAKTQAVSQERSSKQYWIWMEEEECPDPHGDVECYEKNHHACRRSAERVCHRYGSTGLVLKSVCG